MDNLDAVINKVGFEIAKILDENLINKLLGVLANDGVYAMWIYALNKLKEKELLKLLLAISSFPVQIKDKERKIIKLENIQKQIELFKKINGLKNELKQNKNNQEIKEELKTKEEEYKNLFVKNYVFFKILSKDLNQLLFFKELLEKALIYARYHAKAMKDE